MNNTRKCIARDNFGNCIRYETIYTKPRGQPHNARRPSNPTHPNPNKPSPKPSPGRPINPQPKRREKQKQSLVSPYYTVRIKPNSKLTNNDVNDAHLVQAAKENFKGKASFVPEDEIERDLRTGEQKATEARRQGISRAQKYLDDNNTGWKVNEKHTNSRGLVLERTNPVTGQRESTVAYRGTEVSNLRDWRENLNNLKTGNKQPYVEDAVAQMNRIRNDPSIVNPEKVLGFSLGGHTAQAVGDEFNINSKTFNPFISETAIRRRWDNFKNRMTGSRHNNNKHEVVVTRDDGASVGRGLLPLDDQVNHRVIEGFASTPNDPFGSHTMKNFTDGKRSDREIEGRELTDFNDTELNTRPIDNASVDARSFDPWELETGESQLGRIQARSNETLSRSRNVRAKVSEGLDRLRALREARARGDQPTELRDYSDTSIEDHGKDILSSGMDGKRDIQAEKDFDARTQQHRETLKNLTDEIKGNKSTLDKISDALPPEHKQALRDLFNPASIGAGLATSYVGDKIADLIDPDGLEKHREAHNFLSGGIQGGLGVAAGNLLSGSSALSGGFAAFAPEMVGVGTGFVVGDLAAGGITSALEKAGVAKTPAELTGSTVGGAVGGVTTVATTAAGKAGIQAVGNMINGPSAASATTNQEGTEMGDIAEGGGEAAGETAEGVGEGVEAAGETAEVLGEAAEGVGALAEAGEAASTGAAALSELGPAGLAIGAAGGALIGLIGYGLSKL